MSTPSRGEIRDLALRQLFSLSTAGIDRDFFDSPTGTFRVEVTYGGDGYDTPAYAVVMSSEKDLRTVTAEELPDELLQLGRQLNQEKGIVR